MRSTTTLLCTVFAFVALTGCDKPSEADCEKFADHMVKLTTEEAVKILGEDAREAAAESAGEERGEFLKTCKEDGTKTEVDCAVKQNSIDELTSNCT